MMNSTPPGRCPPWVFWSSAVVSSVAGSMWSPLPGWTRFPTSKPSPSAQVVAAVNQSRAWPPIRPSAFMLPTLAMPVTITRKISGATTILISLMKPSPNGAR